MNSPIPWKTGKVSEGQRHYDGIFSSKDEFILDIQYKHKKDFNFILKAVNQHDQLVKERDELREKVKKLEKQIEDLKQPAHDPEHEWLPTPGID